MRTGPTSSFVRAFLQPPLAVAGGLALGLVVAWIAGENPLTVLRVLAQGAFGTSENLGWTLSYATPLVFTGLAVALPFHAGMFNIGAEGQLTMGALAAAAVGILAPGLPPVVAPLCAGIAAFAAGAIWGSVPGWLRARRGSHEVINTIMLNFVAFGLASYTAVHLLKNPESQNPETRGVAPQFLLPHLAWFDPAPVSLALPLALVIVMLFWVLLWRSVPGFEWRALGASEDAAVSAGISVARCRVWAFVLGGGLAGLVGVVEVLGNAGRFKVGFSPEYGFMGIAVALLGRNRPVGILAAALLFGALHKGAAELDLETEHVTREVALVMQALILAIACAEGLWDWTRRARRAGPATEIPA